MAKKVFAPHVLKPCIVFDMCAECNEFREDGNHISPPETLVRYIDITPPGLKTHEGQERVRIAQTDWENHTAEVANMIEHMIDGGQVVPYDDGASKEAWRELRTAIRRRIAKQDAFLKAVAGQ